MRIKELIELLKAMPEKMEGFNSEGELVVLNTHKTAWKLEKSLRNCDIGTAEEQSLRFDCFCYNHRSREKGCGDCPLLDGGPCCELAWTQMPYGEGAQNADREGL